MTVAEAAPPEISERRISRIIIGERAGRDVSNVDALATDIAHQGLRHPVILGPESRLILGPRRLQACKLLGWTSIPAVTVSGIWQAIAYLQTELADADHHTEPLARPLSPLEAMGMDTAMRELAWWPRKPAGGPGGIDRVRNLGNDRRKLIAELLGMNGKQYINLREMWQAAQGFKETLGHRTAVPPETRHLAVVLLPGIELQADITPAYAKFRGERPLGSQSAAMNDRRPSQRRQVQTIEAGLASMAGIMISLTSAGPLDPAIPAELLDRWEDEAGQVVRGLNAFRRKLREQGNDDYGR